VNYSYLFYLSISSQKSEFYPLFLNTYVRTTPAAGRKISSPQTIAVQFVIAHAWNFGSVPSRRLSQSLEIDTIPLGCTLYGQREE
jgi:hypothetical protein